MPLRTKPLFLLLPLILISLSPSKGMLIKHPSEHGGEILYKIEKVEMKMNNRKLMLESTLDYDDAGPNPKHDPRRKPGGKA
ncbi:PREDICTED: uncharacterized protein LOC104811909 [Tarenaya hassleriana]|uniref:uncharacterized protein LOC104811909 n=1 Tax=Tarenaya hassleriana TaxID=28532 RepID=UPI00053C5846|nr:PREDICTED: uncharacterized protein LOC104811909 [Tarenaya hassleriana]